MDDLSNIGPEGRRPGVPARALFDILNGPGHTPTAPPIEASLPILNLGF